jgi:hypothetical protein
MANPPAANEILKAEAMTMRQASGWRQMAAHHHAIVGSQ